MMHALRGQLSLSRALRFLYFWPRARPESVNDHLSGLFLALPWSYCLSTPGAGPGLTFVKMLGYRDAR
jgi:hypothetical protein